MNGKACTVLLLLLLLTTAAAAQDVGAAQFESVCARCHNSNGDGKTAAGQRMSIPDLRLPAVQILTDQDLFQRIGNGAKHKQYPHAFLKKGMNEGQVWSLVAHIRTLKAKDQSGSGR